MISSAIVASSGLCTSASISACIKAHGTSVTTTYHPFFASFAQEIIIALSDIVGELVSALVVFSRWLLLSAHPLAFIVPSLFSFRRTRYLKAIYLSS